jgi:hypothetical protein
MRTTTSSTRDITSYLQTKYPDQPFKRKDVENEAVRAREEALGGYTPTQALVKLFVEHGVKHYVRQLDGHVTGLLWTYPWCEEMWNQNPQVLSMDNTYKTNRYKMPFLNITGVANTHSTFNVAFAFLNKEDEEAYTWAIERLDDLRREIQAPEPHVIITDFEKALKNALESVWEGSQQQICLWHINKNVVHEVKKRWIWSDGIPLADPATNDGDPADNGANLTNAHIDPIFDDLMTAARGEEPSQPLGFPPEQVPDSPTGFIQLWKHVCYAVTEDDFKDAWVRILEEFSQQEAIISYILETYIPFRREWATCFVNQYRNFGIKVTSRTEGSHKEIKSYLRNAFGDLLFVAERIKQLVDDHERAYKATEADEAQRIVREYQKEEWLGNMRSKISRKAVKLVVQQHNKLLNALRNTPRNPDPLPPCSQSFVRQFGLPCAHRIQEALLTNAPLDFTMTDSHWHLGRDRVSFT